MLSFIIFIFVTLIIILAISMAIKVSDKHDQQDQSVINAYNKVTGSHLNKTYMFKGTTSIGLDSPQDPALDSILKNHMYKTLLFFIDKGILVLKRSKDQLKSYQLIPYSHITRYYYKINESHTRQQTYVNGTLNILFDKGTIWINGIDVTDDDEPLLLKQLGNYTTEQQKVAPTHSLTMNIFIEPRDGFRYKVKHHIQTNSDTRWHHIISKALIKDHTNAHKRIKKYLS